MDMDQGQVSVNTFAAHRLLQLAEREGCAAAVAEGLFQAHFSRGQNLADTDVLIDIACRAGLDAAKTRDWLQGQDGLEQLQQALSQGQQLGIQSVPTFVLNGRWAIGGAQPVDLFERALRDVAERSAVCPA